MAPDLLVWLMPAMPSSFADAPFSDCYRKVCFNAAISACERSSRWEMALAVLRDMRAPDWITFGAVMSACAKGPSLKTPLEAWVAVVRFSVNNACSKASSGKQLFMSSSELCLQRRP